MNEADKRHHREPSERELAALAGRAMARRDEEIDGAILSRLGRARAAALEARQPVLPIWLPAGAAVAASLLLAIFLVLKPAPALEGDSEVLFADGFPFMSAEEFDIDLLEEADFYQWLAEEGLDDHS
ncbi:hypothetical protein AWR36_000700 [Microbulbifer flavimaris]|uniref:DUF3619 family protein n=1 Tax=Microbulbifer flavimaris TaxID=1781068 RepID=A0ABX4I357_9GAMM|nr:MULTISPECIES: hypothetical protein [Microbulbifer]KUJ84264.1 hypothetical protein AVO43_00700 [Microbulbifer sp. ZGT114]PCO06340.1 hypothetical protein AWR36_000700 [Microbulbifer flavimaris]